MIRNIIFDMGQVLKKYDPDACITPYVESWEDVELIRSQCFASSEWQCLDAGTISYEDALAAWKKRIPERLADTLDLIIENWDRYMTDLPWTCDLVRQLSEKGYSLYLLSNVSVRFDRIREFFPVLRYMKGAVLSAYEKVVKPDRRIYEILLERYHLDPAESVFIDDVQANVDGAESVGIHGIRYDGDVKNLISSLAKLGVSID
ncbi:MAG: HAD family hydrolase [Eubacteriales bacterium]